MLTRNLGPDLTVSELGLGCMPMSSHYGAADPTASRRTLERAVEAGVTFWDSAAAYGHGANEELLAPVVARHRDRLVIATKFGIEPDGSLSGRPQDAHRALDESLHRLGCDYIDLWYLHRVDPNIPIEDTVEAMAMAVQSGKVRFLGLSEASATTLRRAHAIHPIAALQSEWSLWSRDIEAEVLPTARELGVGIVPYSPLGRGLLTGQVTDRAMLAPDDRRLSGPRFSEEHFDHNRQLVVQLEAEAARLECSVAQLALAWVLAQGDDVVPIPGTRSVHHLEENIGATQVVLDHATRDRIGALMQGVAGDRYAHNQGYGDTPPRD